MKEALPVFYKGVKGPITRKETLSVFALWSPRAFPVVLGAPDVKGAPGQPVAAAVALESGSRVVAWGHELVLRGCCSQKDGLDLLLLNSIRWLAGAANRTADSWPPLRVAVNDADAGYWAALTGPVKQLLNSGWGGTPLPINPSRLPIAGFAAAVKGAAANGSAAAAAAVPDVYVIDAYTSYSDAQLAALLAFAAMPGKGLLVLGQAWYWGYSHPAETALTDLPVNRLLWPLGLGLSTRALWGFAPLPSKLPPASWAYHNANITASRLIEAATAGGRKFTDKAVYPTAVSGLDTLLRVLPPRSALALAPDPAAASFRAVYASLQRARSPSGPGVGPDSPLDTFAAYPGDTLDVMLEAAAVRSGDQDSLYPSASAALFPGLPSAPPSPAPAPAPSSSSPPPSPPGPTTSITLMIDGSYAGIPDGMANSGSGDVVWRSTGAYAPPGGQVWVVLLAHGAAGKGLQVQIGAHTDDLSFKRVWRRVPRAVSRFDLRYSFTPAGSPLGGLVYILVPRGCSLGQQMIQITGVVRAPYYQLGATTNESWTSTVRQYPGPWAELDSGRLVLMVPSKAVRNLADPAPLLRFWNSVLDGMAWLANMEPNRVRKERFLLDADITYGWMHAGYPIMAYNTTEVWAELLDLSHIQSEGAWGPFHELGHNHEFGPMAFPGTAEALNNIFSVYASTEVAGLPASALQSASPVSRAATRQRYLRRGAKWASEWKVWVALDTFLQLQEGFGWGFYRSVYAEYQRLPRLDMDDSMRVQLWVNVTSVVAGRNLAPFYAAWGFPLSSELKAALARLPAWTKDPMNPPK